MPQVGTARSQTTVDHRRAVGPGAFVALAVTGLLVAACGGAPGQSGPPTAAPSGEATPSDRARTSVEAASPTRTASRAGATVEALVVALEERGADVELTGSFTTDPVGGQGVALCVNGQRVQVYVFPTAEESKELASRIDPYDPSNMGTTMVSWAGNPRFWRSDRLIVLYLGEDPAVEAGLTGVLGLPFARGAGQGPGQGTMTC